MITVRRVGSQDFLTQIPTSPEPLPNVEFGIGADDVPSPGGPARWELARLTDDEKTWLLPDFGFFSWAEMERDIGGYTGFRCRSKEVESRVGGWENKENRLVRA